MHTLHTYMYTQLDHRVPIGVLLLLKYSRARRCITTESAVPRAMERALTCPSWYQVEDDDDDVT